MTRLFLQAKRLIDGAHHIALSTHANPDLDGLGSLLALSEVLRQLGKNPLSFSLSPTPEFFRLLPLPKIVDYLDPAKIDLIIGLDYGAPARLEILNAYPTIKAKILSFDHHAIGQHLGLKIVDPQISSTAELIYNFINFLAAPIDSVIAACLLAGIMDDTGQFRHANTSAQTLRIAGELMLKGASLQKISRAARSLNPDEKIILLTEVFSKIKINRRVQLVFAVIEHATFCRTAAGFDDLRLVEILSSAPEAKLALTITEKTPGLFDVSLRSQSDRGMDVARLAASFGGGGHCLAAGFQSDKTPEKIIAQIEKLLLAAAE
ncbi:DHH family phosphoesterase [Patescibacteria group bacterium]|nr:DHH family phosphoesterase [Patescibacteria group bacterium]MBU2219572.1 DHH family phosphoesterase [Patescibacteria group bacterium]MBU2265065.1 DHH family phosphoesterase [Patescibacteria group bacterium]